jgi:hypothetical protein
MAFCCVLNLVSYLLNKRSEGVEANNRRGSCVALTQIGCARATVLQKATAQKHARSAGEGRLYAGQMRNWA